VFSQAEKWHSRNADFGLPQLVGHLMSVLDVPIGDGDDCNLNSIMVFPFPYTVLNPGLLV
jgi:hypothetical protein